MDIQELPEIVRKETDEGNIIYRFKKFRKNSFRNISKYSNLQKTTNVETFLHWL